MKAKNKFSYGIMKSGEEGAELAQAVLKCCNHGDEYIMEDGNIFFEKLVEEFGDTMAAVSFAYDNATEHFKARVIQRASQKREKYEQKFV